MKRIKFAWLASFLTICTAGGAPIAAHAEQAIKIQKRCGWILNPTPGNWDFIDRHGLWQIAMQGEEGAVEGLPEDRPTGGKWWVQTNSGGYGYGCMCLHVQVDMPAKKIVKITRARSLLLKVCRTDKAIKKFEPVPDPE